jgi:2-haloacid dehalogenase
MHRMPIKLCVFDAYGTLFDVGAPVRRIAAEPMGAAIAAGWVAFAETWRRKQLEYTWLRAITGAHADFATVTAEALDWTFAAQGIAPQAALAARLLDLYRTPDAFPEVPAMLDALEALGQRCAILSNGTPAMLAEACAAAGIGGRLAAVMSVERVGVFKPDRRVYGLVEERFGVAPHEVVFVSANGWDAAGGAQFGFRTVWINRRAAPAERLPGRPEAVLPDLGGLAQIVAGWTAEERK